MSLYEELGLSNSASPEDIRKAHRTLSRLLHPDQQTDETLRQAAELQMRRVNIIAGVLLDPQQRRKYDDSLRAPPPETTPPSYPVLPRPIPRASFSLLDLIGIIVAAVMVTLLVIWLFGGEFIHWRGLSFDAAVSVDTVEAQGRSAFVGPSKPLLKLPAPDLNRVDAPLPIAAQPVPPPFTVRLPAFEPVPQRRALPPVVVLQPDTAALSSNAYPPANMKVLPGPEIVIPADNVVPPAWSFSGLWLLPSSGRKAGTSSSARQAPQFIQISISHGPDDMIFGNYSARYETPDRPISPEVAFAFEGPVASNDATFDWKGADGSRGIVVLKLLNPRSMQVTWQVSSFGTRIGIAGGAAVVIRKVD